MSKLLLIGGNGALGRAVLKAFTQASWKVLSIDVTPSEGDHIVIDTTRSISEELHENI